MQKKPVCLLQLWGVQSSVVDHRLSAHRSFICGISKILNEKGVSVIQYYMKIPSNN